jgi:hypothetical protein
MDYWGKTYKYVAYLDGEQYGVEFKSTPSNQLYGADLMARPDVGYWAKP